MKRTRRWAIIGLLCACGFFGCVQVPSRGLFVRRSKPAIDEPISEDLAVRTDDVADASARSLPTPVSQETARSSAQVVDSDVGQESKGLPNDSMPEGLSGGLFGVSTRNLTGSSIDPVEAPSPKFRTTKSRTPAGLNESAVETSGFVGSPSPTSLGSALETGDGVVSADFQVISGQHSSNIELAAVREGIAPNPWNRFRELTTNVEAEPETADLSGHAEQPVSQPAGPWPAPASMRPGEAPANQNSPTIGNLDQERYTAPSQPIVQPGPQFSARDPHQAPSQAPNVATLPEPWPHAAPLGSNPVNGTTSRNGFGLAEPSIGSAGMSVAPSNVQWVNAEQPRSNPAPLGFNGVSDPVSTPQVPTAVGGLPPNFGDSSAVPATIPAFVSSPELERLITQTTVEAAAMTPGDNDVGRQLYLRKQVQLRLLQLIAGQTDRALQPVPGIDSADQEFWQLMFWGMANYFDTQGMPDSSERATQTVSQLRAASARLQERARLQLQNVVFCRKITGFGDYQRFSRDEFTPGQPVLLYAEVEDFKSEPTPDGKFRTLMKSTLEIIEGGPSGRSVESLPLAPSEDRCRNQRRDYYHSYEFSIPTSCNPGPHTLRLRVEDQLGRKTATTMLNFTVQ